MVELDALASLDGLLWMQTGDEVAQRFRFNQSTVSRHQRKCSQAFGVAVRKMASEWHVVGDTRLLHLERRVHQHARFQGQRPLRLEATYWSGVHCTVTEGHPLLRHNPLELEHLADFPSLALPEGKAPTRRWSRA